MKKITVIDTTFATFDMAGYMIDELENSEHAAELEISRVTVPGFKDLAAPARRASDDGAEMILCAGMPGPEDIDEACSHDASFGLQMVQALTGTTILEIFVHMTEALNDDRSIDTEKLEGICEHRCREHAKNALRMMFHPQEMVERAGSGRRQGGQDVGSMAD